MHRASSSGSGLRLPGGRHFVVFAMYTLRRDHPIASIILSSSSPAGPTNGSPRLSSCSPGASPTNISGAPGSPTPNTIERRVVWSLQRVHSPRSVADLSQRAAALGRDRDLGIDRDRDDIALVARAPQRRAAGRRPRSGRDVALQLRAQGAREVDELGADPRAQSTSEL